MPKTTQWNGAGDGESIEQAANYTNGVPVSGDTVIFPNPGGAPWPGDNFSAPITLIIKAHVSDDADDLSLFNVTCSLEIIADGAGPSGSYNFTDGTLTAVTSSGENLNGGGLSIQITNGTFNDVDMSAFGNPDALSVQYGTIPSGKYLKMVFVNNGVFSGGTGLLEYTTAATIGEGVILGGFTGTIKSAVSITVFSGTTLPTGITLEAPTVAFNEATDGTNVVFVGTTSLTNNGSIAGSDLSAVETISTVGGSIGQSALGGAITANGTSFTDCDLSAVTSMELTGCTVTSSDIPSTLTDLVITTSLSTFSGLELGKAPTFASGGTLLLDNVTFAMGGATSIGAAHGVFPVTELAFN